MKKLLIALLAIMLLVAAVGCGQSTTEDKADDTSKADDTADVVDDADADVEDVTVEEAALAYFANLEGNNIVEWTDLFTKIDDGEEPYILSIRQADVYGEGHIEGAYLAAWGDDLADKVSMLPTDEPVYVYCYTGQTAGQTVALLRMLGIEAYSVKSGFNIGAMGTEGYKDFVTTEAAEIEDADAAFNADVLAFVEDYFKALANAEFKNNIVASEDLEKLAADRVVLDIRKAEDFEKGHIDGAQSLPYGKGMDFSGLSKDDKYVVVCYSGQTAGQTVAIMRALGFDAISLKSGMMGWDAAQAPTPEEAKTEAALAYFANLEGNNIVSWEDLFAKIDNDEEPFILSIRQADVYGEGHIEGAYLASWGADLAAKVAMLPTDQPVYVYCYSGQTAGQTIALLRMLGIEAYSVKSGYNVGAMAIEGYEDYVSTEAVELPDAGAAFEPVLLAEVQAYFNSVADNSNYIMAGADVQAAAAAGEVTVLDIRQADVYAVSHIAGAVSLPYGAGMDFSSLDKDANYVVACYSGQTAGQTVAVMRMLGFNAVSLKSGMNQYLADGLAVDEAA